MASLVVGDSSEGSVSYDEWNGPRMDFGRNVVVFVKVDLVMS